MAGNIILPILSIFQGKGIKDATDQLKTFGGTVGTTQGLLKRFGSAVTGAAIGRGAYNFLKEATVKARDYERELKALETIFGSSAPEMKQFAMNSADIGLTTTESAKASVFLGSVLKQSGFTMGKVSDETKHLVSLASDLATVYGYDVSDALTGMTALFRGEYDPIEKFGVAMKQAEVNALLLERGQKNLTGSALRQAQAQARLDLLYQRSADSQGAFARGQGTLFVEQRNLSVAFDNFQAQIAQAVVPALAKMMGLIGDFVTTNGPKLKSVFEGFAVVVEEIFKQLSDSNSELRKTVDNFVALLDIVKEVSIFMVRHAKIIAALAGAYYGVTIPLKLWAKLLPIVTAVMGAFETAMLGVSYAFDLTLVSAGLLTGVFGILALGLGVAVANTMEQTAATRDLLTEAANLGITVKATAMENSNMATQNLTDLQAQIDKVKSLNDSEEYRFLLRHNEWLLTKKLIADEKAADAAAAEAFKKKVATYKAGFAELLNAVGPASFVTRTMGQFESAVSTTFRGIYNKIHAGLTDGLMTGKAHDALIAYAQAESSILGDIARKRDEFSNRYSLSKTLIADTKNAIQEFASISNLMSDAGAETTKTTSYMLGKFKITTTETLKSVTSATTIIDKYKTILASTKTFSANLLKLGSMGLSDELRKQILGAGLDQGSAMAQALVEGGPDAIKSLNTLFTELGDTGKTLGEDIATSLYGDGVDMSKGLLQGLLDAEKAFADGGETLATAFETGFTTALGKALTGKGFTIPGINTSIYETLMSKFFPAAPKVDTSGVTGSGSVSSMIGSGAGGNKGSLGSVPQQTVNVTVNAGVGADPISIGGEIVKYVNKWAKVNNSAGIK